MSPLRLVRGAATSCLDGPRIMHAWTHTGGQDAGVLRFHCNSRPEVTFEDLVFDVEFEEPK